MLRPRPQVKLSNQKILHWYQDLDLVTECRLERMSAMSQCWTQFSGHAGLLQPRVANSEVMELAEPDRVGMFR